MDFLKNGIHHGEKNTEILKLADAASDVYQKSSTSNILMPVSIKELHARKIDTLENVHTGFKANIFRDEKDNIILSYKGTQSIKDWWYGNTQSLGINSSQYKQAGKLAKQTYRVFGDKLKITGHSLGGGLATLAAAITNRPAITFNSAGVHRNTLKHHMINPQKFKEYAEQGKVIRCIVKGEILNAIQDYTPLPNSIGLREDIIDPLNPNTLNKHSMDSVKRALEYEIGKSALTEAIKRPISSSELVSLIEKETNKNVLEIFADNQNPNVQKALAANSNTSVELLHHFSLSKDANVREAIATNKNTPINIVYQMTKDKSKNVSLSAKQRINENNSSDENLSRGIENFIENPREIFLEEFIAASIDKEMKNEAGLSNITKKRILDYASLMDDAELEVEVNNGNMESLETLKEYFVELDKAEYVTYSDFIEENLLLSEQR